MISFFIPGAPLAFKRSQINGKRHYTDPVQAGYMDLVRLFTKQAMRQLKMPPLQGPLRVGFTVVYPYPDTWSPKKREAIKYKTSRPDCDNLIKLQLDAMNTILYQDDAQVATLSVTKIYGAEPGVSVFAAELI